MAGTSNSRLPLWMQRAFWAVVAIEWVVAGLTSGVMLMPIWHRPTRDAVIEMLCLTDKFTRFAPGYSDAAWSRVRVGDDRAAVIAVLGPPLQQWSDPGGELWSYSSQSDPSASYLERKLVLGRVGRVIEKHEECYVD